MMMSDVMTKTDDITGKIDLEREESKHTARQESFDLLVWQYCDRRVENDVFDKEH